MSIKLALVIVVPIIMGIVSTYCTVNLYSDNLEDTTELRLIVAIWLGVFGSIGILVKMNNDENTIRTNIRETLESNYSGLTYYKDQTFVYDSKKYSYDYNYDTNTLTVFDGVGTGTVVNSIQIEPDGKGTADSETTSESAVIDTSKESMNLDSIVVSENQEGLAKRIQDKIQEKYANAVITSFDTANLTGTFESDTGDYGFSWSDNMLEIFNLENKDQNVYYKVSVFYN